MIGCGRAAEPGVVRQRCVAGCVDSGDGRSAAGVGWDCPARPVEEIGRGLDADRDNGDVASERAAVFEDDGLYASSGRCAKANRARAEVKVDPVLALPRRKQRADIGTEGALQR